VVAQATSLGPLGIRELCDRVSLSALLTALSPHRSFVGLAYTRGAPMPHLHASNIETLHLDECISLQDS